MLTALVVFLRTKSVATLITKMSAANPLWGTPRIHGELRKLGIEISERTVSRLLRQRPHRPSQSDERFSRIT
jgi:hypothetical protein